MHYPIIWEISLKTADTLIERTPEILKVRIISTFLTEHEITAIDPEKKQLTVKDLQTDQESVTNYDKLIISAGARPYFPDITGVAEATNSFVLRSVTDADRIKTFIQTHDPKMFLVLGAGVMGLELAENFHHLGMDVTLVDHLPQVAYP